jgi:LCP family protein required for cell wall assembly
MSETSGQDGPADPAHSADQGSAAPPPPGPPARTRRKTRIVLVSLAACVVFLGAVAVGAYLLVNHLASGIHRVKVTLPKVPGGQSVGGMTVLITSASEPGTSGLIMLMHFDAHDKRGGVVSIPPQTLVQVPGHGLKQIETALGSGGPSLLVKTVEQITHVQIDHYARISFTGVSNLINVIGGVNVTLPKTTVTKLSATQHNKTVTKEYTFHAGLNHLNGITAVYYVRDPSFSPDSRVLLQQNLLRAILDTITSGHMLTNPLTAVHVVPAVAAMLTVDSNFTNSEVEGFAIQTERVGGSGATFVTAPTYTASGHEDLNSPVSDQLWAAIRHDSIAAFAAKYPATLTPSVPG